MAQPVRIYLRVCSLTAERSAAELVERRAGTEGNADQLGTCWTQRQISVTDSVGCGGREVTRVPAANAICPPTLLHLFRSPNGRHTAAQRFVG
jgi:hypothetical protein